MPRSRARWSAQPPFAVTDTRIGTRARSADARRCVRRRVRPRRRRTTTAWTRTMRSASCRRGMATSRATSGRSGISAPATPTPAAPASTSCAHRTADRPACASPASSRSSGRRPKGSSVLQRRQRSARGAGPCAASAFGATYTLAKSRDNASTIGGGGTVVAQDDQNLAAEWGLSSFDRRHQLSADVSVELPFGQNRPWLNNGGVWARAARELARVGHVHLAVRHAVHAARAGSGRPTSRAARAAPCARTTTATPSRSNDPTIDLFFNTGGVLGAGDGDVRHRRRAT